MKTDTAHQYWNDAWTNVAKREEWETPEERIAAFARTLPPNARVLDLGCGVGRHALLHAALGHRVTALDAAPDGLAELERKAVLAGVEIETRHGGMDQLPFEDGSFDHVLSFNVIYHADEEVMIRTIREIFRVLRPGGTYQGTMLTLRGLAMTQAKLPGGREISRNTWVFEDPEGDKRHPHHFCGSADLFRLFEGFDVLRMESDLLDGAPGGRWHLILERPA